MVTTLGMWHVVSSNNIHQWINDVHSYWVADLSQESPLWSMLMKLFHMILLSLVPISPEQSSSVPLCKDNSETMHFCTACSYYMDLPIILDLRSSQWKHMRHFLYAWREITVGFFQYHKKIFQWSERLVWRIHNNVLQLQIYLIVLDPKVLQGPKLWMWIVTSPPKRKRYTRMKASIW